MFCSSTASKMAPSTLSSICSSAAPLGRTFLPRKSNFLSKRRNSKVHGEKYRATLPNLRCNTYLLGVTLRNCRLGCAEIIRISIETDFGLGLAYTSNSKLLRSRSDWPEIISVNLPRWRSREYREVQQRNAVFEIRDISLQIYFSNSNNCIPQQFRAALITLACLSR